MNATNHPAELQRGRRGLGTSAPPAGCLIGRFNVSKPESTTAEFFFALWRAVEQSGADADVGLRLGVEALTDVRNVAALAALVAEDDVSAQKEAPDVCLERLVAPEAVTARPAEVEHHVASLVDAENEEPTAAGRSVRGRGATAAAAEGGRLRPRAGAQTVMCGSAQCPCGVHGASFTQPDALLVPPALP
jgi:hypothetical protein